MTAAVATPPTAAAPIRLRFIRPRLYPQQQAFVDCKKRYAVIEASTKSGKTVACLVWLFEQAARGTIGQHYWWVAPTYATAGIAYRRLCRWLLVSGLPVESWSHSSGMQTITLFSRAMIWFKGADNTDGLYGEDVYAAVIDEASRCAEEAWVAVRTTLTATKGRCKIIGNVKGRGNWAYRMARQAERGDPEMAFFRLTAWDAVAGGVIDSAEIADAQRVLPAGKFRELYLAQASDDGDGFFNLQVLQATRETCIRPPTETGELLFNIEVVEPGVRYTVTAPAWMPGLNKCRLSLWCELVNGRPSQDHNYAAFADVSSSGASNSVLKIVRVETREEVAELVMNDQTTAGAACTPSEFANYAVAVATWFGGQIGYCLLGWEANGPGIEFGRQVLRCGYHYVLGNRDLLSAQEVMRDVKHIGWWSTGGVNSTKMVILSDLRRAMAHGEYLPRSEPTIREMEEYVERDGKVFPISRQDDSETAREAHGDRVIAAAGTVMMLREQPKALPLRKPPTGVERYIAERAAQKQAIFKRF